MSNMEPSPPGRVILDVGANVGDFAVTLATRNPGHRVLAVEPIAALAAGIEDRVREQHLANVEVVKLAIDEVEGPAEINVAQTGDWGVSSLLSLDTGAIARDDYWSIRPDLVYTRTETVERVTLQTLMTRHNVEAVDFLKLDVQGLDLLALKSAGDAIPSIRAGMLEVPTARRVRLYADENQDLGRAYTVLEQLGFEVYAVKANDPACNEVNVYFIRRGEDADQLEEDLGLRGVELYDGKHFWAIPCSTIDELHATEALPAETARLRSALSAEIRARREAEGAVTELTEDVALAKTREMLLRRELARAQAARPAGTAPAMLGEVSRLREEVRSLRQHVGELTASDSWRVTAPLRKVGGFARWVARRR